MNEDKARELAKRFGVRMCDEHGDTHDEELYCLGVDDIIDMAKALAQSEQEPVGFEAWHKTNYVQSLERYGNTYKNSHVRCRYEGWLGAKAAPPQRTWVGLTKGEVHDLYAPDYVVFHQRIEAKLKEKNT